MPVAVLYLERDYLTGFHKRKQARRRFGLAMQEIKDRKERLEERKEVRRRVLVGVWVALAAPLRYIILRSMRQLPQDSPCAVLSCRGGATAAQSTRSVEVVELPQIGESHHSRHKTCSTLLAAIGSNGICRRVNAVGINATSTNVKSLETKLALASRTSVPWPGTKSINRTAVKGGGDACDHHPSLMCQTGKNFLQFLQRLTRCFESLAAPAS